MRNYMYNSITFIPKKENYAITVELCRIWQHCFFVLSMMECYSLGPHTKIFVRVLTVDDLLRKISTTYLWYMKGKQSINHGIIIIEHWTLGSIYGFPWIFDVHMQENFVACLDFSFMLSWIFSSSQF